MKPEIYSAVERAPVNLPLQDLISGGRLDLHPEVVSAGYFAFSVSGRNLRVLAGDHVGFVPLNERAALLIEPKVARDNWIHIVSKAGAELHAIPHLRQYLISEEATHSVIEFLCHALIRQVNAVSVDGMLRRYTPRSELTSFPRGRIELRGSIAGPWARGQATKVRIRHYEFSKDTPHNRLVKYALHIAEAYVGTGMSLSAELASMLVEADSLFSQIPLDRGLGYVEEVEESIRDKSLPHSKSYYEEICQTALLIVQRVGLFPYKLGDAVTYAFVVNMASVFEDYCHRVLEESSDLRDLGFHILSRPAIKTLFEGGASNRAADPDVVVRMPDGSEIPIEVKYKAVPTRADMNQAITYAVAYRSEKAMLVTFSPEGAASDLLYLGSVGGRIRLWVYQFNLESLDLPHEESEFQRGVASFLNE